MLAIGFVVSFLVAYASVAWFMAWVRKHGFAPFAVYRIVVGILVLAFAAKLAGKHADSQASGHSRLRLSWPSSAGMTCTMSAVLLAPLGKLTRYCWPHSARLSGRALLGIIDRLWRDSVIVGCRLLSNYWALDCRTRPMKYFSQIFAPTNNRRLNELIGFLLCVSALLLFLALASYSPLDPSFNSASVLTGSQARATGSAWWARLSPT